MRLEWYGNGTMKWSGNGTRKIYLTVVVVVVGFHSI